MVVVVLGRQWVGGRVGGEEGGGAGVLVVLWWGFFPARVTAV